MAVSLSAANNHASLPIAYWLYLPHEWIDDPDRRAAAGVPDDIGFQTKPQIALNQLRAAYSAGIGANVVLADAGYGNDTDFRDGITEIGLAYAVGIQSSTSLWPPGVRPLPAKPWSGRGRPPSAIRRDGAHQPISAKQLALELPKRAWRRVTWREGTNTKLAARFAAVRVRPAHRDYQRSTPVPFLLIGLPIGKLFRNAGLFVFVYYVGLLGSILFPKSLVRALLIGYPARKSLPDVPPKPPNWHMLSSALSAGLELLETGPF